jgi:hypothetical protein
MIWFFVTLPLMVVAVGIATVPVVYHSVREHRMLHGGATGSSEDVLAAGYWTRPGPPRGDRAGAGDLAT